MKYLKWLMVCLLALVLGLMVALKPGLFVGIVAVLIMTAIIVFLAVWRIRQKTEEKPSVAPVAEKKIEKKTSWGWAVAGILVFLIAAAVTYNHFKQPKPVAQQKQICKAVIIAPVEQWSENFSVPPGYWYRIRPEGKIKRKDWNGTERNLDNDFSKTPVWRGDNIPHANYKFISREDRPVKVVIYLQKK